MIKSHILELMMKDLSLTEADINQIIYKNKIYRRFLIKKRSGGFRLIHSASPEAKMIQVWLARRFFARLDKSSHAFAFRKNCSVIKNANSHKDNLYLLKYDVKDFFPSITYSHFMKFLNYNKSIYSKEEQDDFKMLEYLVKSFCFLKERTLPQGFCSSPIISNSFMGYFDIQIENALKQISPDCTFTRYADDISISFNTLSKRKEINDFIVNFFSSTSCPFKLNQDKTRFGKRKSGSMFVNGIKICENGRLTIHRDYKDKIRRLFYSYGKKKLPNSEKLALLGHLYYLRSVDPFYFNKLFKKNLILIKELRTEISDLKKNSKQIISAS
ncbi:reverse transcriptase domain-containing protein [Bacteriovorax sp. PP10]|uniref:RNA-directed DNA polymerase n=1 Tax=Bacteriovorax antarcticus TaxID=3088717 RepID=A0ABU5VW83_9BACT|nr:reverse transcriptase domain-containing protein [Bacteriovorax sp. PP10]MEA9357207.1 reverse transcriptase domain-containing protein [Bacteriovorax sp. PP10]